MESRFPLAQCSESYHKKQLKMDQHVQTNTIGYNHQPTKYCIATTQSIILWASVREGTVG